MWMTRPLVCRRISAPLLPYGLCVGIFCVVPEGFVPSWTAIYGWRKQKQSDHASLRTKRFRDPEVRRSVTAFRTKLLTKAFGIANRSNKLPISFELRAEARTKEILRLFCGCQKISLCVIKWNFMASCHALLANWMVPQSGMGKNRNSWTSQLTNELTAFCWQLYDLSTICFHSRPLWKESRLLSILWR